MRLFEGTEFDRPPRCEACGALDAECTCPPPERVWLAPEKQTTRITVEKRKRGKQVTVVRGLSPDETDLHVLLTQLKSQYSAGGTLKDGEIEIQGDQLDRVREALSRIGYRIK